MCWQCKERESSAPVMGNGGYVQGSGEPGLSGLTFVYTPHNPPSDPKPDKFYALSMSEHMYTTVADLYERQIEGVVDIDYTEPIDIEVWTVAPNLKHLPSIDSIIDMISQMTQDMEIDEDWWEKFENAVGATDVRVAIANLRELISSKITYWMADKHIDTLTLEINKGRPLVDGKPVYKLVPEM